MKADSGRHSRVTSRDSSSPRLERFGFPIRLAIVFALLAVGIATSGWLYYLRQKSIIAQERNHTLAAIADLKVSQIVAWRREVLANGEFIRNNGLATRTLADVLKNARRTKSEHEALDWMRALKERRGYSRLLLVDAAGVVRLAVPEGSNRLAPEDQRLAAASFVSRSQMLSDLHRDTRNQSHLDLSVPIFSDGVLLLEVEPRQSLFPIVEHWPVPSRTAELLLVRREGEEILYPERRNRGNSWPRFDDRGVQEAIDNRGAKVIAAGRAIPSSPWLLIAKVDTQEIYGSIRESAQTTGLAGVALFAASAAIGFLIWRNQQIDLFKRQYASELERRELLNRFQNISDGFAAFDREWRYTYINAAGAKMAGRSPEELLGGNVWELWPELAESPFGEAYRTAVRENRMVYMEDFYAPLNAWFEVRCYPSSDGLALLYVDTTERKRAEETVRLLSSIVESSDDAIISKDLNGTITSWNQGAERIYGYTAVEAVGRSLSLLVPPDHPDEFPEVMEYICIGQRIDHLETERLRKDGQRIFVSLTISPIQDAARRVTGASVIARDITERKRAEMEILAMNRDLEKRVAERTLEWETANRELEAFAYSVSHDLRAPLRAIDGLSRILLEDFAPQLPEQAQHYLQVARANSVQMGNLIDALLAFSRMSRRPLSKQKVDLAAVTRRALKSLRAEREGRLVEVSVGELPPCEGDPQLLMQVMVNLLSNAHKYTRTRECARIEMGAIRMAELKRDQPELSVPDSADDESTVYFVRDNGVGFDMQYRDKLFGVFQRLHSAEEFEGTGAGLAMVQRIILRHGGQIWADAEVDRGAAFYFTIGSDEVAPPSVAEERHDAIAIPDQSA